MEPLTPADPKGILEDLATEIIRKSAALNEAIHPNTRVAMAELLRPMNSYYSNLIEGHDTHPIDIEKALKNEYSEDKEKRDLQEEAKVHIALHRSIHEEFNRDPAGIIPSSTAYLKKIHADFYAHLPEEFKLVVGKDDKERTIVPGAFRECSVQVGKHIGPAHDTVPDFMDRFESYYDPRAASNRSAIRRIIHIAASHHRLVWIHPFLDGNGRVVRLFSDASFMLEGLDSSGLWSISRGLSRSNKDYKEWLANADSKRRGDHDGRGNLSDRALTGFCTYFLETALDQLDFMHSSLKADGMLSRLENFVIRAAERDVIRKEAKHVLQEVFLRGSIAKPDAERIMKLSDKPAKAVTDTLIEMQLLSPKKEGKVIMFYPNYPISISPWILPDLYPESKESEMMSILMNKSGKA